MERKIEFFTVRELMESALKGFANFNPQYTYQVVFFNRTTEMENAKMFVGIWQDSKFYELKITMKRERIEVEPQSIDKVEGIKATLYADFYNFISKAYPILKVVYGNNKLYVLESIHDYEISFIYKKDVRKE